MTGYISDGYCLDGYVKGSEKNDAGQRLWDDLEFNYRPAARLENVKHDAEVTISLRDEYKNPECAVKAEKLACDFVAKHVVSWNLKDSNGLDVACNSESCGRINAGLFQRLYSIIRGTQLSDVKPGKEKTPASDEDQQKN